MVETVLIFVDIMFDFEMKRDRQRQRQRKKNKRKQIETHPPGIKLGSADSKSEALITVLLFLTFTFRPKQFNNL